MKHTIPPAIRVFISSTFSDMLNERKYFNTVLDPELSRLCASRGVSFFAVDLRWGITEEQANNGEVIPMCLREIDHCRPFFIGIIGNRYGSTLAEIGLKDDGQFPWLAGRENKSATELEMLYGVLECEEGKECPDCLFMLRSDELSAENFKGTESEEKRRCVEELRKRVTEQEDIPCEDYNSLEEFGEKIIRQFTIWLDENFPSTDSAAKARHDFYNGELMRNYVRIKQAEDFVDRFCHYGNVPLLICGSGPRGKTSLLTHWEPSYKGIDISVFSEPVNEMISPRSKNRSCRKILINVESDPAYVYWPNVAYEILDALECEKHDRPGFYETEEELEEFRRFFVKQVENKFTENLIYIVINDIDKMKGAKAEYLSWLPSSLPDNLNIICSAGDPEIASTAELLGWGVQELQVLSEELQSKFLQEYLTMFGKNLNAEQEFFILGGGVTDFAGNIKLIVRFLNQYAAFESLSNISMDISECITSEELLNYIWNYACRGLNDNIKKSAEAAAYFLASSSIAPTEDELFTTVNSYITTTPLEWNTVRVLLDLFGVNKNDTWSISDSTIRSFFENMPIDHEKAESILYSHYKSLLRSKDDSIPNDRKTVLLTKAVICHMLKAKNYTDIGRFLCDPKNMRTLSGLEWDYVRSAWLKVLLYSDENVESMLRALPGKEAVSLLLDLGFEKAANEEAKRRKVSAVSELKFKYSKYMSPEVSEFYQTVCRVFDTQVYPLVCEMINNFLSGKKNKLNSYEKFQLYYELADAYTLMQNHSGGLEIAAKAYKEALRSMSDYNIMLT
ncbi:MAG: DUF4062 domain-containing protein, partial [Lachnospiraceae bacterium]|nr:DUF4062 domain-containing protein [Lachnospiraceae bacterium]